MGDFLRLKQTQNPVKEQKHHDCQRDNLADLFNGVIFSAEQVVHPTKESDEIKEITEDWRDRAWEYRLMDDPETEKYLNEHGVYLISYRELTEMRRKKNSHKT